MASRKSAAARTNEDALDLRELTKKIRKSVKETKEASADSSEQSKPALKKSTRTAKKTASKNAKPAAKTSSRKSAAAAEESSAPKSRAKKSANPKAARQIGTASASKTDIHAANQAEPDTQHTDSFAESSTISATPATKELNMKEGHEGSSNKGASGGGYDVASAQINLNEWSSSPVGVSIARPPAEPSYDPYADQRPLPAQYNHTRLTLLVRDPEWIFAFWELSEDDRQRFSINDRRMVLRVYDVTGVESVDQAHRFHDVGVTDYSTSWYLHVAQANRAWAVDLGVLDENGNFIIIARSNIVATPRDRISEVIDDQWMEVDEERFQRLMRMSTGPGLLKGASEMLGIEVGQRLFPQYMPGASEMFALGASERLGASESQRKLEEEKAAPFHLQVRYELIVYGSTEPDAKVTLCGESIKLRPDGSFTVRYELPDGDRTIDVKAVKSTGDQSRQVTTRITKDTH